MAPSKIIMRVPREEWQVLENQLRGALERIGELEREKTKLLVADPTGQVPQLLETIRAAIPVVSFAVGNLHPDDVRGWPYLSLQKLANLLEKMPTLDAFESEYPLTWRIFAKEAEDREMERAQRIQRLRDIDTTKVPPMPKVEPVSTQSIPFTDINDLSRAMAPVVPVPTPLDADGNNHKPDAA